MIGKLKKIVGTDGESGGGGGIGIPTGVKVMGAHLQRKFAKGVQYNMKVIIKGERNTGKSTLLYRLQGYKFVADYNSTDEIQVAVIHWTAATSADVVKVDIWDIVDKGKSRKKSTSLKISNEPSDQNSSLIDSCLDADFLNVYQGTHAVIFIFDITKKWTYDYVIANLPLVPHEIPILVMANFMDNRENRVVTENTGMKLLRSAANRPLVAAPVVVIESSLKNGFGLKMVHQFFNLPFLSLQRKSLQQMLDNNKTNTIKINEFFQNIDENKDCDYERFMEKIEERRNQKVLQPNNDKNLLSPSNSAIFNGSSTNTSPNKTKSNAADGVASATVAPEASSTKDGIGSKLSRMFSKRQKVPNDTSKNENTEDNIDSFLAEGGGMADSQNASSSRLKKDNDDSDEDAGNPMVEAFYEDFASDENNFFEVSSDVDGAGDKNKSDVSKSRQRTISTTSEEPKLEKRQSIPSADPEFVFLPEESPRYSPPNTVTKYKQTSVDSKSSKEKVKCKSSPGKMVASNIGVGKTRSKTKSKVVAVGADKVSDADETSSTTTSEGGEVPINSDEDDDEPTSEDPEADAQFKNFIKQQATSTKDYHELKTSSSSKSKPKSTPPKKSPTKGNRAIKSSSESESHYKADRISPKKQKKHNDNKYNKVSVDSQQSNQSNSSVNLFSGANFDENSNLDDFFNDNNKTSEDIFSSANPVTSLPVLEPQNSVPHFNIDAATVEPSTPNSLLPPTTLNLVLNSNDLAFLETTTIGESTKPDDSLISKEKKKKKSSRKEKGGFDVEPEVQSSKKSVKTKVSKKSAKSVEEEKGFDILLSFEEPGLDSTLVSADVDDPTEEFQPREKKFDRTKDNGSTKKKKVTKNSNASGDKSNKREKSSTGGKGKTRNLEVDNESESGDSNNYHKDGFVSTNASYHKNDGYESL